MKSRSLFLLALGLAGMPLLSLHAADYVATVQATPGLLGYWRYTPATGANSNVNGYTGTFNGNAALGAPGSGPALAGYPTNAGVSLDGTNNTYVDTNLVGGINGTGSMVGWFNLATLPNTVGRTLYIAGESQFGNDFDLQIDGDNVLRFYTNSGGAIAAPTAFSSTNLNQWIFVAATFTSNGNATLYVNGAQVAQGAAGTHNTGSGTFSMGASDVFGGRFYQGSLDEIAVFNTELSASQVTAIYNSAGTVPEPSTWAFLSVGALLAGMKMLRGRRFSSRLV